MNRLLRLYRPWMRPIMLGALLGASLGAAQILADEDFGFQFNVVDSIANWLAQTRWVWPLTAVVGFAILTSPRIPYRWFALPVALGMIGLTGLIITFGSSKVLLALGGIILIGLLAVWVIFGPIRLAPPLPTTVLNHLGNSERLEAVSARLKLQNDLRTTALQAIAGMAVLAGAVLAFQQLSDDRHQAAADRELTRQGQASERFTRAISQLGNDRREVQLGGIYGLEQIAQQAPVNRLAVTEVLVAYLHRRAPRPAKPTANVKLGEMRVRAPDVQAALTVLGRRQTAQGDPSLDLQALDLSGANLYQAELSVANLSRNSQDLWIGVPRSPSRPPCC